MYEIARAPIERGPLPPGRAGTLRTLELMRRLVFEGGREPVIRDTAHAILRDAGVRPHDFDGELRAVFEFVRDRIRYVRDPAGLETLQSARRTLHAGMGDCDDKAILLAALLRSIGNPARLGFRVIGTRSLGGFSHVYVVAQHGARRVALDPTRAGTPPGWEYPRPTIAGDFQL